MLTITKTDWRVRFAQVALRDVFAGESKAVSIALRMRAMGLSGADVAQEIVNYVYFSDKSTMFEIKKCLACGCEYMSYNTNFGEYCSDECMFGGNDE